MYLVITIFCYDNMMSDCKFCCPFMKTLYKHKYIYVPIILLLKDIIIT